MNPDGTPIPARIAAGRLQPLRNRGQSVWLDYIRREFIDSGALAGLIREAGVSGLTSNPSIFEKAFRAGTDYDEPIRKLLRERPDADAPELFRLLAAGDLREAADLLRPVWDETGGADGFVSFEVSPELSADTTGMIEEGRKLFRLVGRPNVMIKIPATPAGIPAIETLTAEGINVNITLMFSMRHYEEVSAAFLRGLGPNPNPERIASVASFFVSRVDTKVDAALAGKGKDAQDLLGKAAVANARRVYRRFREIFGGERFAPFRSRGARVQRVLWASTSTKNPAYRDTLYVEELIGPDTVNTLPVETLEAFLQHGAVRGDTVLEGWDEADRTVERLSKLGIDLEEVGDELQREGIESFAKAMRGLREALEEKVKALLPEVVDAQRVGSGDLDERLRKRLEAWDRDGFARRLRERDHTLWSEQPAEITNRLGWLDLPEKMLADVPAICAAGEEVARHGFRDVLLLGMGGSSLAPEMFGQIFGSGPGRPALHVLDTTHPDAVLRMDAELDCARTFFLVSSKSGTTLETLSLFRYFWARVGGKGEQFAAITDPGTPLEQLARERMFRWIWNADPDVGGRFSALTPFGLVPAAMLGVDIEGLLHRARRASEATGPRVPAGENAALVLGAALGEAALAGTDKAVFRASPALRSFPLWLEQLFAESTGKNGRGIIPVVDEPIFPLEAYNHDRFFIGFALSGGDESFLAGFDALEHAGYPVARILLKSPLDLGEEIFRFEAAVAAAGSVLGINPFDQPDVEEAKRLARSAMEREGETIPEPGVEIDGALGPALSQWMHSVEPGDWFAIQAYVAPAPGFEARIAELRTALLERTGCATTFGYGPRFLHSTGQLHKGGPGSVLALQLVDEPAGDAGVPETDRTFGEIIRAQALGDYEALVKKGRRVLRVRLGRDPAGALAKVIAEVRR